MQYCMVRVVTHACTFAYSKCLLSLTVQQICMKFGLAVAHNSGCLNLLLEHWSSFRVRVASISFSTFVSLFKCTVHKDIETLVTPHSKVLCN